MAVGVAMVTGQAPAAVRSNQIHAFGIRTAAMQIAVLTLINI